MMTTTDETSNQPGADKIGTLSPRELAVARAVWSESPDRTTAKALGIAPCTLKSYLMRIRLKLGVKTRIGMARQYERWRLCWCPPNGLHPKADMRTKKSRGKVRQ